MRSRARRCDSARFRSIAIIAAAILGLVSLTARGATRWSQTYDGPAGNEGPLNLRELPDHSVVIAGHTDSFGTGTGDAWWIRIDGDGHVLDQRVYGNALPGGAAAAVVDPDGGMAVAGAHTVDLFTDRDAWVHHVDATGAIDWAWSFDSDPGLHSFFAVAAATGGYVAVGATAVSTTPPIYAWAARLDHSGNLIWHRRFNGGTAELANQVVQTADGGYAIAGWSTSSGAGSKDLWLLKIGGNGTIQWQKTYGGPDQEEATGLVQTPDGGYALSAFTNSFSMSGHAAWVLRLDGSGNVLWQKVMGDTEWSDFDDIVESRDGNLICTGRISGSPSNDLWVVKFRDFDGSVLWQRAYEGDQGDWGSRTIELDDHDLLIAGVWAWGFPEEAIWIQRTDATGSIPGCPLVYATAVTARAPAITVQDGVTVVTALDFAAVAVDFIRDSSAASVAEKCRDLSAVESPGTTGTGLTVTPNPIRTSARIAFRLGKPGWARLGLYDVGGRRVRTIADGTYAPGWHDLDCGLNGPKPLPAGVYYLRLDTGDTPAVRRLIVIL